MRNRSLTSLLLAGLVIAACGTGSTSSNTSAGPKHGDKLTIAVGIDPDTLDPAAQTTTTASQVVDMMAEPLVNIDEKGVVKPLLATKWDQSADGLSWTFTLRSGVKFSDGTPFNAQAVKFSIDRLINSKTQATQPGVLGGKSGIQSVDVVDDANVKFTLGSRFAPFAAAMTQTNAAIISPASASVAPNTPTHVVQPVGTGPYKFKDRQAGDHITLEANKDYWGQKPNYDTQVLKVVPDATSRESLIRAGQADVIALPPGNDLPALQHDNSLNVIMGPSDRTIQIVINTVDPKNTLLQKPAVRQALNYAVDKDAIIKTVLFGAAVPLDAPMSKALFGYCSVGSYKFDQSKAKQMLQAAGASGMTVKLLSPTGRYLQDSKVAEAVAGYLTQAGLKVEGPQTADWPTYLGTVNVAPARASTDLHLLGWAPAYMDASQQFQQFLPSQIPPAGLNTSYYGNPQVTELVTQGNTASDPGQRKKAYCDAQKIVWNDAPWIFLYNQRYPFVTTNKVKNVTGLPNEKFVTSWVSPA